MWEVMSYGERPYWELSNHEVSITPFWGAAVGAECLIWHDCFPWH